MVKNGAAGAATFKSNIFKNTLLIMQLHSISLFEPATSFKLHTSVCNAGFSVKKCVSELKLRLPSHDVTD